MRIHYGFLYFARRDGVWGEVHNTPTGEYPFFPCELPPWAKEIADRHPDAVEISPGYCDQRTSAVLANGREISGPRL